MAAADVAKLVFLAAIWGSSFIFLRIIVPEVGPLMTALLRMSLASVALLGFVRMSGIRMQWRRHARAYAVVGLFATALPFSCFSYASQFLPAAHSALLNATSPLFGALFSTLWLAERASLQKIAGLVTGVFGVGVLVGAGAIALDPGTVLAAAACLLAAASYAVSSIIVKKTGHPRDGGGGHIDPTAMATGSMALGAAMLSPALPFVMPHALPSLPAIGATLSLALLSSGVAQAMFIPMIVRIGPTRAMSVGFLIPLFGMLWGFVFLGEPVALSTLVGGAIVLQAMALVLSASRPAGVDSRAIDA